jgi:hypothetical protein
MSFYKLPTVQERNAMAAKAKQAALEKLRTKPPVDEAVLAQRREAELAREAALAQAREDRLAARALEKAQKQAATEQATKAAPKALTPEEQKALRDARYAARKNRLGK